MKTNNPNRNKSQGKESIIFKRVDRYLINKLAKFSGFINRKGGKIKPYNLIIGFMIMTSKKLKSFDSWASEIASISGISLSKQAVEERMNYKTENMLKLVFEAKLCSVLEPKLSEKDNETAGKFIELFIEDCTVIPLPANLAEYFPGNVSRGEKKSQAKIHALHNVTKNDFSFLDIHSFTENDQSLAPKVLSYLKPGQLIIRDLGFHVLSVFKTLIEKEIYFISRKKFNTKVFDKKTGKQIDLLRLLRKKKYFDGEVLIGATDKIKMRLVIVPIPEKQAEERRRKERKNRDKRIKHSLEYYELLGYTILITNVPIKTCTRKEIIQLYSLRWRIETIFKTWKSHFSFEEIMPSACKNPYRVTCIMYLMLLQIILFQVVWMNYYLKENKLKAGKMDFSLVKLSKFFSQHLIAILTLQNDRQLKKQLIKYCRYEKRNDRENTMEKYKKWAA